MTIVFATQTHCAQGMDPAVFATIKSSMPHVTHIRDELFFHSVYNSTTQTMGLSATFQTYLDALSVSGLGMIVELLWGNAGVTGNAFNMPRDNTARGIFCDYASFVISELKARHIPIFGAHLWNEISGNWPGTSGKNYGQLTEPERAETAASYILLAEAVFNRLNADHPDVPFGAGADVALQLDWLNRVLPAGLLDVCDAVDLHPYGGTANMGSVRAQMTAAGFPDMPVWCTEFGATPRPYEIPILVARMASDPGKSACFSYYLAEPFGSFSINAALMDVNGNLTPSGAVYEYVAQLLGNATFQEELAVPLGVRAPKFSRPGLDDLTVLWSDVGGSVTIVGATAIQHIDGSPVTPEDNYTLTNTTPIYVFGDNVVISQGAGDSYLASVPLDTSPLQGHPFYFIALDETHTETPMTYNPSQLRYEDTRQSFWYIYQTGQMHPPSGVGRFSILRYIVPAGTTRIKITGGLRRASAGGDGDDIWVRHNGEIRFRRLNWPRTVADEPLNVVFDATAGDQIDLITGPGAAGSNSSDAFNWRNITFWETNDDITEPDFGPSPIPLYVKDSGGQVLYTLIIELTQTGSGARQVGARIGFFNPNV